LFASFRLLQGSVPNIGIHTASPPLILTMIVRDMFERNALSACRLAHL